MWQDEWPQNALQGILPCRIFRKATPAAGEIAVKKMMGDYCAYCDGVLFGLICDNNLYIKVTEPGRALLKEVILRPPYEGARDYFYISDVDDSDYLSALIKATLPALEQPKR